MPDTTAAQPAAKPPAWQWLYPVAVLTAVQIASGRSQVAMPPVFSFDKVAHFFVFGLVATLILRQLATTRRPALLAVLLTSLYGALDEIHQAFTPGRDAGVADWIADTLGASVAALVHTRWPLYRRLLNAPVSRLREAFRQPAAPRG
ncbi:MAG: VanZ family protein [Opitutaceae bacterium]|jgi:VanZ family protein|nr:VanZ family protein [Opitutaceae bacterium]